jgi:heme/copper-type cytochrome/quinol oxidase subunit 1
MLYSEDLLVIHCWLWFLLTKYEMFMPTKLVEKMSTKRRYHTSSTKRCGITL